MNEPKTWEHPDGSTISVRWIDASATVSAPTEGDTLDSLRSERDAARRMWRNAREALADVGIAISQGREEVRRLCEHLRLAALTEARLRDELRDVRHQFHTSQGEVRRLNAMLAERDNKPKKPRKATHRSTR